MSVRIEGAVKRFGAETAVDGVSLDLPQGAFLVVVGPSGCGKSTLLRLVAGLETLDDGAIALDGRAVAGPGLHVAPESRRVGVVFQSYALWPHMSVARNVAFPVEAAGASRRAALEEAMGHLRSVSMEAFADRAPAALSGGQRQRAALARCLASRAGTVLMDEPLANLDPHLRAAMEEELAAFHARAGVTTLYITHDQREAMALGDVVAVMGRGRFLQVAPPEDVYARPASEEVARFIGRAAVLDATIERVEGATALARAGRPAAAASGPVRMRCAEGTQAGPSRIVLRPEDAAIDAEGPLRGVVGQALYRGGAWEATVEVSGLGAIPVVSRNRLRARDAVGLRLLGGWALPGRKQGGAHV
ncbi:ABC transporter ATP-binding protein [Rubrimonas cliftonensis]|uniref:Carbohydrate ABC transporter ATP-binding protein, CUT1 family n=1 Tax=Rubrimonas cliftonensis TaxID=89524 RepID=A0A1H3X3P1_9RHOB|nr:ABC transporter ATP-binding protein [Rubrimonas cliftonensis]SDZ93601.1 carbohydrate ABC transporter ATP-binding protein, CUT1 family [Rubrimonas cliftonensis]